MVTFKNKVITETVDKLINGKDYRDEVVNAINIQFLDFCVQFFRNIVSAKSNDISIGSEWYKKNFIKNENINSDDIIIYSGMNKKTITNIYGSAKKEIVLDVAEKNFDYLSDLIENLGKDNDEKLDIRIKITHNNKTIELTLLESLLVINALATKKIAIRGGAWSSIGKKVEKPLMVKLCGCCNVPKNCINSEVFKKDGSLDFDREIDFKLYDRNHKEIKCEEKLMGRGNPEAADVVIARDTNIFVADTLSDQNKAQLTARNVKWLELRNKSFDDIISEFKKILDELNIEHG